MPDENSTAVESSPAAPAVAVEVPTAPAAYAEWRKTGKTPAEKQPKAESAPAKKSSGATPVDTGDEEGGQASGHAAESDPAKKSQEHQPSKAERRLNEILEDLRNAGLSPSELKTFKRDAQQPPKVEKPAEHTEKPAETSGQLKPPIKPKPEDFKTWDEYEAARDQYFEDLADYKAAKAIHDDRARQAREHMESDLRERLNKAKERYGEGADATIVQTAKSIFEGDAVPPVLREVLGKSPVLVDLMYVMGSKPEELAEFLELAKSDPSQALRKAVLIERLVIDELKGSGGSGEETPARDKSGQFAKAPAKETKAPPPPKETSGRSGPPPDAVESAAERGDFRAFREAANRRDLLRRKGQ